MNRLSGLFILRCRSSNPSLFARPTLKPWPSPLNCVNPSLFARPTLKPWPSPLNCVDTNVSTSGRQLQVQPFKAVVNHLVVAILKIFFASVLSLGIVLPCGEIVMSCVMWMLRCHVHDMPKEINASRQTQEERGTECHSSMAKPGKGLHCKASAPSALFLPPCQVRKHWLPLLRPNKLEARQAEQVSMIIALSPRRWRQANMDDWASSPSPPASASSHRQTLALALWGQRFCSSHHQRSHQLPTLETQFEEVSGVSRKILMWKAIIYSMQQQ